MATREIRLSTDEILRKVCKPVKAINENTLTLLDDMAETMYAANGVGLAAPQVGILKRIVTIDIGEGLIELINPVVVEKRGSQIDYEACLSVPGRSELVDRPEYVRVEALNRHGEKIVVEGEELMAVALCHETDHLDGVLYIDKAIPPEDVEEV
ncbi:peptide deformylase [Anaerotignum sp.]|uniref:peptide deformylase n=1 Tax=Anaerotignum sp. TaxID=2039241 RepID=UPI0028972AED|nr:peptide deformylase [Anaerotignum sp.]